MAKMSRSQKRSKKSASKAKTKKASQKSSKKVSKKTQKKPAKATQKKLTRKAPAKKPAKNEAPPPPPLLSEQDSTASEIMRRVRETLSPIKFSLRNLSTAHKGHAEAKKHGGGHYAISVVSEVFSGLSLQDRQRWVMGLVQDLFGKAIHALQLDLKSPQEVPLKQKLVKPLRNPDGPRAPKSAPAPVDPADEDTDDDSDTDE